MKVGKFKIRPERDEQEKSTAQHIASEPSFCRRTSYESGVRNKPSLASSPSMRSVMLGKAPEEDRLRRLIDVYVHQPIDLGEAAADTLRQSVFVLLYRMFKVPMLGMLFEYSGFPVWLETIGYVLSNQFTSGLLIESGLLPMRPVDFQLSLLAFNANTVLRSRRCTALTWVQRYEGMRVLEATTTMLKSQTKEYLQI